MICWRDQAFCSASVTRCENDRCSRYFGPKQRAEAEAWWGGPGAPVQFADLSEGCAKLVRPAAAKPSEIEWEAQ